MNTFANAVTNMMTTTENDNIINISYNAIGDNYDIFICKDT